MKNQTYTGHPEKGDRFFYDGYPVMKHRASPLCKIPSTPLGLRGSSKWPNPGVHPGLWIVQTPLGLAVSSPELDKLISIKTREIILCETNNQLKLYT